MKTDKRFYRDMLVVLAYLSFTVFMTYPLILNFFTHVPGCCDVFQNLWNFWWVKKAIIDLHTTPYYSQYISQPAGENIALSTLTLGNSLLAIPLQDFVGMAATYNILFFASFLLSAYGTYLLVRYLTKDDRAAFVSGAMFAFCPYRFAHALSGHLNLLGTGFIPLYVLFLIKTSREKNRFNPIMAGVFFFATALYDWHYMCFLMVFSILFFSYQLWFERSKIAADTVKRYTLMMIVFGLMILPFAYPVVESMLLIKRGQVPMEFSITMSADVMSFFVPSQLHPLLSRYFGDVYKEFSGVWAEKDLSVGFMALALTLYYILKMEGISSWIKERVSEAKKIRKDKTTLLKASYILLLLGIVYYFFFGFDFILYLVVAVYSLFFITLFYVIKDKRIGFWPLSAVVFFILALGPLPHVFGEIYFIPLPYIVFPFLPILSFLRDPGRFGLLVMLSLAVISGYSLTDLLKNVKKKNAFTILVTIVVLFEFLAVPLHLTELAIPSFYERLSKEGDDFVIIDFPVPGSTSDSAEYMYYQTGHEKRIIGGYVGVSLVSENSRMFLENTPVIQAFRFPLLLSAGGNGVLLNLNAYYRPGPEDNGFLEDFFHNATYIYTSEDSIAYTANNQDMVRFSRLDQSYPQGDIIRQDMSAIGRSVLGYYGVGYIIVHEKELGAPEKKAADMLLADVLPGIAPVYVGEGIRVYAVPKAKPVSFAVLGGNWHAKEPLEYAATRWMSNNATIELINSEEGTTELSFDAKSFEKERELIVFFNKERVGRYSININFTHINISGLKTREGNNTITFYTTTDCTKQKNEFKLMTDGEDRCASIAFRNVSMMPKARI